MQLWLTQSLRFYENWRDQMVKQEQAETLALEALNWMAGDADVLGQFLGWSGASADDLRGIGASPDLMLAVIDFILLQDEWVIAASEAIGIPPQNFASIRGGFPGGRETHWT